ncbi:hypothetical protein SAY87_019790 [Trapa incisa]|uniref:Uncharacterized protein n=1 Tax=Trapa incisa TaxID=236973 RepID=A0AAN7K509_9MYRT|nr:hypothetical protein SAY87_019790 [Trapa incisa]
MAIGLAFQYLTLEAGLGFHGSREEENQVVVGGSGGSMSFGSISKHLMETLPGRRADEFLDYHQLSGNHHHHGHKKNNSSSISHGYYDRFPFSRKSKQVIPVKKMCLEGYQTRPRKLKASDVFKETNASSKSRIAGTLLLQNLRIIHHFPLEEYNGISKCCYLSSAYCPIQA